MAQDIINALKKQLQQPLPGMEAQFAMAHVDREKIRPESLRKEDYRESAVLLLLCKKGVDLFIPLTERHAYKGLHSAQISLPGGKLDETDPDLETTARRECFEEIGLREGIEIIGELTPVFIPVSRFSVKPFVGFLNAEKINYTIDTKEVRSVLELDLSDLKDPATVKQTVVEPMPGIKLKTPYFDVQGKIVWGATAMILNEFKQVLMRI